MNRRQLEHVIRAAVELTGETEIVVVGSQAILAVGAPVPDAMLRSQEADLGHYCFALTATTSGGRALGNVIPEPA